MITIICTILREQIKCIKIDILMAKQFQWTFEKFVIKKLNIYHNVILRNIANIY